MRSPSCSREPHYRLWAQLHLPNEVPYRTKHEDKPFNTSAPNAVEFFKVACRDLLLALGYTADPLIVGLLLELVNSFPVPVRQVLLRGIAEGRGLTIVYDHGEVIVDLSPKYDRLEEDGTTRTPHGLIVPGR